MYVIIGFSSTIIDLYSNEIKIMTMEFFQLIKPLLTPVGIALIFWGFYRAKNRRTRALIIAIHVLDNIRFHKIKDDKKDELLYLGDFENADTSKEERELKIELSKPIHGLSQSDIDYVCNTLYREKKKT